MSFQKHLEPHRLERYSFLWSEARLVIAAVALLLGGVPPLSFLVATPTLYGLVGTVLTISWIISGLASAYLIYRWSSVKHVFGGNRRNDIIAFWVMIVSGLNLGLTGLTGNNLGMS